MSRVKILVIDDEKPISDALSASLRDEGYLVDVANNGAEGLERIRDGQPDVVLLDIWMPGKFDGLQVLAEGKKAFPEVQYIVMSGHGTIETAVKAVKGGAWDFVEKPLSMDKISILLTNILSFKKEQSERKTLLNHLRRNIAMIGESPVMVSLKQMIARVAPSGTWVLVTGESGTGKELVAQNIHYLSPRAGKPFIEVNCASVPTDLIEAELFGFEKGAFAGSDRQKKGKFDFANGGTLFLDEVGDLSLDAQAKVLRILQEQKFQRVGGTELVEVDVRVVAATNKNLEDEIKAGRFREDFYYRLNVVPLRIAPLRQRAEDLTILAHYFGDQFIRSGGYQKKNFSDAAIQAMKGYSWPGNVRELKNFIERVYILTPGDYVDVHDLKFAGLNELSGTSPDGMATFREARARFEKEFLLAKIVENDRNISKTAEAIGLERSYLHRKIKTYGIEV